MIHDAALHPYRLRHESDRVGDDGVKFVGVAEDIDDVDGPGEITEAGIAFPAEDFLVGRIDGKNRISGIQQIHHDGVAVPPRLLGSAYKGDDAGRAEKPAKRCVICDGHRRLR